MSKRQRIILNFFGTATKPPAPKQSRNDQPDSQVRAVAVVDASASGIEDERQGEFELRDEDISSFDDDGVVIRNSRATHCVDCGAM